MAFHPYNRQGVYASSGSLIFCFNVFFFFASLFSVCRATSIWWRHRPKGKINKNWKTTTFFQHECTDTREDLPWAVRAVTTVRLKVIKSTEMDRRSTYFLARSFCSNVKARQRWLAADSATGKEWTARWCDQTRVTRSKPNQNILWKQTKTFGLFGILNITSVLGYRQSARWKPFACLYYIVVLNS